MFGMTRGFRKRTEMTERDVFVDKTLHRGEPVVSGDELEGSCDTGVSKKGTVVVFLDNFHMEGLGYIDQILVQEQTIGGRPICRHTRISSKIKGKGIRGEGFKDSLA